MIQIRKESVPYRPILTRGRPARKLYRTLWVSTDGRKQKIVEMPSEHIVNCLGVMDRILAEVRAGEPLFRLKREQDRFMAMSPEEVWPPYEMMKTVLTKRGVVR